MQSKTLYRRVPIPFRVPRQVQRFHRQPPAIRVHASTPPSSSSYDSEGDDLLREFQQYTDPNRLQKITKRLELTWSVDRVSLPASALSAQSGSPFTELHITLVLCCRGVALRRVTAAKGLVRRNVHGAEAQVRPIMSKFRLPYSEPIQSVRNLLLCAGAMMVGEERFCSLAHGCKQCPICNSKVRTFALRPLVIRSGQQVLHALQLWLLASGVLS